MAAGANDTIISAPINLPHGAIIKSIYIDGNAASAAATWNFRAIWNGGAGTAGAAIHETGNPNTIQDNLSRQIDNEYSYFITIGEDANFDSGHWIYIVEIIYTI